MPDPPDALNVSRHRDLAGRGWHPWIRRALVALVAVLPIAALLNVFGQHPTTSSASAPAASLTVYAPSRLRGGDLFEARFRILAHRTIKQPQLVLDPGWLEQMTLNGTAPQASNESTRDGRVVYSFSTLPAGRSLTVWIYFQANPTNVARRREDVELDDGQRPLVRIHRTITIFP